MADNNAISLNHSRIANILIQYWWRLQFEVTEAAHALRLLLQLVAQLTSDIQTKDTNHIWPLILYVVHTSYHIHQIQYVLLPAVACCSFDIHFWKWNRKVIFAVCDFSRRSHRLANGVCSGSKHGWAMYVSFGDHHRPDGSLRSAIRSEAVILEGIARWKHYSCPFNTATEDCRPRSGVEWSISCV